MTWSDLEVRLHGAIRQQANVMFVYPDEKRMRRDSWLLDS